MSTTCFQRRYKYKDEWCFSSLSHSLSFIQLLYLLPACCNSHVVCWNPPSIAILPSEGGGMQAPPGQFITGPQKERKAGQTTAHAHTSRHLLLTESPHVHAPGLWNGARVPGEEPTQAQGERPGLHMGPGFELSTLLLREEVFSTRAPSSSKAAAWWWFALFPLCCPLITLAFLP